MAENRYPSWVKPVDVLPVKCPSCGLYLKPTTMTRPSAFCSDCNVIFLKRHGDDERGRKA